jgi:hypothetical protein
MKYSEAKFILKEFDGDRSIIENIENGETDFWNPFYTYRFIKGDVIDTVQREELAGDTYVLGCFNASFLSEVTSWPVALIEAAQDGEAFEALGEAILNEGYLDKLQELYATYDGYGNHFASYDGNDNEVTINGQLWHYFRG